MSATIVASPGPLRFEIATARKDATDRAGMSLRVPILSNTMPGMG
jgi:hypothetical protein